MELHPPLVVEVAVVSHVDVIVDPKDTWRVPHRVTGGGGVASSSGVCVIFTPLKNQCVSFTSPRMDDASNPISRTMVHPDPDDLPCRYRRAAAVDAADLDLRSPPLVSRLPLPPPRLPLLLTKALSITPCNKRLPANTSTSSSSL